MNESSKFVFGHITFPFQVDDMLLADPVAFKISTIRSGAGEIMA